MAKTIVIGSAEGTRIPFLRGILTRSLQNLGLGFSAAYSLASNVRDELSDVEEITSDQLRERVAKHLEREYSASMAARYRTYKKPTGEILVESADGQLSAFSRAQTRQVLETCGLNVDQSIDIVARLNEHLVRRKFTTVSAERLRAMIRRYLRQAVGEEVAHRYAVWTSFLRSGHPLIVLIGGTAGCGKSTITTELANRLEIVRTVSTDMLREVMRVMLPKRLLPVLYKSSFNAWKVLPAAAHHLAEPKNLLAEGYYAQAELVSVACEAVMQRARRERVSLIVEGVHVHPSLLDEITTDDSITVIMVTLAVLKRKELRRRIRGRGGEAPQRRAQRYLENFESIWRLQSQLLSEADRVGVPIIANEDKEATLQQIMAVIVDQLSKGLEPQVPDVNG